MTKSKIDFSKITIADTQYFVQLDHPFFEFLDEGYYEGSVLELFQEREIDTEGLDHFLQRVEINHEVAVALFRYISWYIASVDWKKTNDYSPKRLQDDLIEHFVQQAQRFLEVRDLILQEKDEQPIGESYFLARTYINKDVSDSARELTPRDYLKAALRRTAYFYLIIVTLGLIAAGTHATWLMVLNAVIFVIGTVTVFGIVDRYKARKRFKTYLKERSIDTRNLEAKSLNSIQRPGLVYQRAAQSSEEGSDQQISAVRKDRFTHRPWWLYVSMIIAMLALPTGIYVFVHGIKTSHNNDDVVHGLMLITIGVTYFCVYGPRFRRMLQKSTKKNSNGRND